MTDESRFFRTIYRINSVLILLLLVYAAYLVGDNLVPSNDPPARGTVEVIEDPALDQNQTVEMRFDGLTRVRGSDTQYTLLETRASVGKMSGYSPSETRNVLFISGDDFDSHWLFQHHRFRILSISTIEIDKEVDEDRPAVAIYSDLIKEDSNNDGALTDDDLHTIALLKPNGHEFTEIVNNAEQIVSWSNDPEGSSLDVLIRNGSELILKRYSLATFDLVLEQVVADL